MISHFARLRAKKGFTIVELVVVVAIITILISMVIPLVMYDTKPAVAKAMAKDMYYKAQEVLTDCKAANTGIPADYTCFYVKLNSVGGIDETGSFTVDGYNVENETAFTTEPADTLSKKMNEAMRNYIESDLTRDMSGVLVAACDTKYRVVGTYWFDDNYIFDAGTGFSEETVLSTGDYCCSYPLALCGPGAKTYRFTDIV